MSLSEEIRAIPGPILVLGSSGFVGGNLLRMLLKHREDVVGTSRTYASWRLEGVPEKNIRVMDLLVPSNLIKVLDSVQPKTVFNCIAYGAYSFEKNYQLIHDTNFNLTVKLLEELQARGVRRYIHAGSSSEYGDHATAPKEDVLLTPNSHYAVSKSAVSYLLYYFGKSLRFPCANLRLYSVYGPLEDSSRLIPVVVSKGLSKEYPPFVDPNVSRDFVYVEDACRAFIKAANNLKEENYGESFNIGTGQATTIAQIAQIAKEVFGIETDAKFSSMPNRDWDVQNWYANPEKANRLLQWTPLTNFREGLKATAEWYQGIQLKDDYQRNSKQNELVGEYSVSAIIACYKDGQAIPIMYERLKSVFDKLQIDYEIIFVNDNSPDDSEEVIREITLKDRRVLGISHSRNFGSQSAFRSGMEVASKNSCVLLDGDLQDPPELIEAFVAKWKEGFDVVYGRRVKRDAPIYMQLAYKAFYRVFDTFSYVKIPHDAGDFSLMSKSVVRSILEFPERDMFIRGIRAFAGFKQTGVDYRRPERMFGQTTNSFLKNIDWAKKGILSFSNTPLTILSFSGFFLLVCSFILGIFHIVLKLIYPDIAAEGIVTVILMITFFGSLNLFGISILGEYLSKVFEEVKRRPHFLRRNIIRYGELWKPSESTGKISRKDDLK
ncbi:MAG: epimerase [Nitrospinae bacterium CG11_big_fil_rev_8_21_14_0_20_45_15]|nr:MAG: epimerase [Nitrospinae bacterium CG11_big_fil_rev_8_21_14_0_20_45_15]